jgi:hypothetical protein
MPQRPKKLYPRILRHHKQLQRVAVYKIILQTSAVFLYTNNEQNEKEYRKTISFTIALPPEYQITWNKFNKECK